jgi:hypothetical protein
MSRFLMTLSATGALCLGTGMVLGTLSRDWRTTFLLIALTFRSRGQDQVRVQALHPHLTLLYHLRQPHRPLVTVAASGEEAAAIVAMMVQDGVTTRPQIVKHAQAGGMAMATHLFVAGLSIVASFLRFQSITSAMEHS